MKGLAPTLLTAPDLQPITTRVERAEAMLLLGQERDALQEKRPDGCWCLGTGGRGHSMLRGITPIFAEVCGCPEGIAARAHIATELWVIEEQENTQRIERTWTGAEIPSRFTNFRLDTSPFYHANPWLAKMLADWRNRSSFFFWGKHGRGKTGLAIGMAWLALTEYHLHGVLLFKGVPQLLSELRSTYNDRGGPREDEVLARYVTADLFIMDDLGTEQVTGSGWVEDRLYQIISDRHSHERATIFTSNLNLEQLANKLGERICWRILEMCRKDHIINLKGRNLREEQ